jgi:hypothetical protein
MQVVTRDGLLLGGADLPDDRRRHVEYRLALIVAAPVAGLALVAAAGVWLREPGGGQQRGPSAFLTLLQRGGYWAAGLLAVALAIAAAAVWRHRPRLRLLLLAGTAAALAAPLAYRASSPRAGQDPAIWFVVELLALPALALLLLRGAAVRRQPYPWRRDAWVRRPVEVAVAGALAVALAAGLVVAAGLLVRRGSLAAPGSLDGTVSDVPLVAAPDGPGPVRWAGPVPLYHGRPGYRILGAGRGVVAVAQDRPGRSPDGRTWSGISVRDAVTGAERWHVYGSTWEVWAGGILDGGTVVVVGSGPFPDPSGDALAMGFDARTGRARWQRTLSRYTELPGVPELGSRSGEPPASIDEDHWLLLLDAEPGPHRERGRLTVVDPLDGTVTAVLNADAGCEFLSATGDRQRLYAEQVCATTGATTDAAKEATKYLPVISGITSPRAVVTRVLDTGYAVDGRPLWSVNRTPPHPVAYLGIASAKGDSAIVWFNAIADESGGTSWPGTAYKRPMTRSPASAWTTAAAGWTRPG